MRLNLLSLLVRLELHSIVHTKLQSDERMKISSRHCKRKHCIYLKPVGNAKHQVKHFLVELLTSSVIKNTSWTILEKKLVSIENKPVFIFFDKIQCSY